MDRIYKIYRILKKRFVSIPRSFVFLNPVKLVDPVKIEFCRLPFIINDEAWWHRRESQRDIAYWMADPLKKLCTVWNKWQGGRIISFG